MISVLHQDFLKWKTDEVFDLIFLDPPFNIGQNYSGYDDNQAWGFYWLNFRMWTDRAISLLSDGGVLCLHGPDNLCESWLSHMNNASKLSRIAWINWHYRFGQCTRSNWIDSRCHCLVYSNLEFEHTWNPEDVLVESDRVKYGDKRVNETERGGRRLPGAIWGIPSDGPYWGRVTGSSKERVPDAPNQLPEKYLERLVLAYTNEGDHILDPFGGSGTTAVVANALGRNCTTMDISEKNVELINDRLKKGSVRCTSEK